MVEKPERKNKYPLEISLSLFKIRNPYLHPAIPHYCKVLFKVEMLLFSDIVSIITFSGRVKLFFLIVLSLGSAYVF